MILFMKSDDFTNETQQAQTFHVMEHWSRWTIRCKLFFAKSGLIGDHFALSCLSHIRNNRTIDCKPWLVCKIWQLHGINIHVLFAHVSIFLEYEFKSLQTCILSLNYIWLRFKILNSLNSVKSWHIWVMMTAIWRWSWSFLQVGVCKAHIGINQLQASSDLFFDWEICHTKGEWEELKEKANFVFENAIKTI